MSQSELEPLPDESSTTSESSSEDEKNKKKNEKEKLIEHDHTNHKYNKEYDLPHKSKAKALIDVLISSSKS